MEIDVIDVLIDQTLNGNMVNVDVKMDIHYSVLSVLEIKLVKIYLKIVMLLLSMIANKEDVYHVQLDVWVVRAAINVFNVDHNLTLMQLQSFVQNIVEMEKDLYMNVMMVETFLEMDVLVIVKSNKDISAEVVHQTLLMFVNNIYLNK